MVDNVNSRPKDPALEATSRQGYEQVRRLGIDDILANIRATRIQTRRGYATPSNIGLPTWQTS